MINIGKLAASIFVLWIFIRTFSYGIWVWRKKNIPGALGVLMLALLALAIPFYVMFFLPQ